MILIDTSVWISFFNKGNQELKRLLEEGEVVIHDMIIGELACGNFKNRGEIFTLLNQIPRTQSSTFDEIIYFIEKNKIYGKGLGYIDCALLVSSILFETKIWTNDKSLKEVAKSFGYSYK